MTPEEKKQHYKLAEQLLSEQRFVPAVIGGVVAAILSAGIYAVLTVATGITIGFWAIGIGVAVGYTMQYLGRGIETKYVVVASILAIVGCILGNAFTIILFGARTYGESFFATAASIDIEELVEFLIDNFQFIDLIFWAVAVYSASHFVKRPLTREEGLAIYTHERRSHERKIIIE